MDNVIKQIKLIAKKYKIEKIMLFGSRARGDNRDFSDYDIAIFGNDLSEVDKARFCYEIEEIDTLKKIDVVFIDQNQKDILLDNITKDGVVIYEQINNEIK